VLLGQQQSYDVSAIRRPKPSFAEADGHPEGGLLEAGKPFACGTLVVDQVSISGASLLQTNFTMPDDS
jgi:hypothetical protein